MESVNKTSFLLMAVTSLLGL